MLTLQESNMTIFWQWEMPDGGPNAAGKIMGHCPNSVRQILAVLL